MSWMNYSFIHREIEKVGACRGAVEKSCVTFYILAYLSKCKEWLHFPDYSNKSLFLYLSNSHMNWIRRITRHGIYCLFTLLQVTKWEQEEQQWSWAEQQQVALHRVSTRNIYTLYTVYSIHSTKQTGLARASPPAGPPLCTGCMQSSTLEQRLNHNSSDYITLHLSYTYSCF